MRSVVDRSPNRAKNAFTNTSLVIDHPHWVKEQIQKILDLDRRDNSQNPDSPNRHGFDVRPLVLILVICSTVPLTQAQILHFKIYLLGTRPGDELLFCNRTRLSYHFCEINPTNEVTRYMNAQCGKMVVAGKNLAESLHYPTVNLIR